MLVTSLKELLSTVWSVKGSQQSPPPRENTATTHQPPPVKVKWVQ